MSKIYTYVSSSARLILTWHYQVIIYNQTLPEGQDKNVLKK